MSETIFNNGEINFRGALIEKLPDNARYQGTVNLDGSNINGIGDNVVIQGDLILGKTVLNYVGSNILVMGSVISDLNYPEIDAIVTKEKILANPKGYPALKKYFIITDGGDLVFYIVKFTFGFIQTRTNYYHPSMTFYKSALKDKPSAIYCNDYGYYWLLSCKDVEDGVKKIEDLRAQCRGYDKVKNLDVDEKRTVDELIDIYVICTNSCEKGINMFLQHFNIDKNKLYTIRETQELLKQYTADENIKDVSLRVLKENSYFMELGNDRK